MHRTKSKLKSLSRIFIQHHRVSLNPTNFSTLSIKLNEMLSKAFSKSIESMMPLFLRCHALQIVSYSILVTSPPYLPSTNPFWSSLMMWGSTFLTLATMAPLIILYNVLSSVIGRQFLSWHLSYFPLGRSVMTPTLWCSDKIPHSFEKSMYCMMSGSSSSANTL